MDFHELIENPQFTQNNYGTVSDNGMGNVHTAQSEQAQIYSTLIDSLKQTISEKDERIKSECEQKEYFKEKYYRMKKRLEDKE